MKRLPSVEVSRSSRTIIKTILTESFIEVGYDEATLLREFYLFIEQEIPENCCFEDYLAQEIVLSDEENFDEDVSFCSEDSHQCYSQVKFGHHDCECYSEMFCHSDHWFAGARRSHEMRDRLRQRLTLRKVQQSQSDLIDSAPKASSASNYPDGAHNDDRNLDDLLKYINGASDNTNCDNKKRKKSRKKKPKNNDNVIQSSTHHNGYIASAVQKDLPKEDLKSKKKKNKKQKNKDKNSLNDSHAECDGSTEVCFIEQTDSSEEKADVKDANDVVDELDCNGCNYPSDSDENSNDALTEVKLDTSALGRLLAYTIAANALTLLSHR